jgi:hypothetical protein
MAISKKERSLSIWIGIAIGVAVSSMLVRYALQKKTEQTQERPGNYKSMACAADGSPFDALPDQIKKKIPYGIVVYFENNQTVTDNNSVLYTRTWIIESAGSFRSERLFVSVKQKSTQSTFQDEGDFLFHRASELYLKPCAGVKKINIENSLNPEKYKIIGRNSKTDEWILQIKDFSPGDFRNSLQRLNEMTNLISAINLIPWISDR